MTEDVEKINQAVATAETFSNLYYKKLDNERHTIDKMYHENATMTWNGNPIEGIQNIQKFCLDNIPKTSTYVQSLGEFNFTTLKIIFLKPSLFLADAQPVHDSAVGGQTTVLVTVAGTIKYGHSQPVGFQQNFLITAKETKWKVVTDTFRSQ